MSEVAMNMSKITTLDKIELKREVTVVRLNTDGYQRRSFINIGILPGTRIEKVRISPVGDPSAYMVRGAIIALRRDDALRIMVEER
jgi:Fe2+ transport system protein FeoA